MVAIDFRSAENAAALDDFQRFTTVRQGISAVLPAVDSPATPSLIDACVASGATTVILSGARSGADVQHLDVLLQVSEARAGISSGTTNIIAMIGDNPLGLLSASSFTDKSMRLIGLTWDSKALASALGLKHGLGSDVLARTRATIVLAAAAAKVAAIDTAEPDGETGSFEHSCHHARGEGFVAKMTDLPSQLPVIRSIFAD